jgi:hypothetical protein
VRSLLSEESSSDGILLLAIFTTRRVQSFDTEIVVL